MFKLRDDIHIKHETNTRDILYFQLQGHKDFSNSTIYEPVVDECK